MSHNNDKKVTCVVCNRTFNNKRGYNTHLRFNKDCYSLWKENKESIRRNRPKIICKICGKEYINITNTHLKKYHNLTMVEYKDKYGSLFPPELLEEQRNLRERTIKERYSPEEIHYMKGIKSLQSRIEKYGDSLPKPYTHFSEEEKQKRIREVADKKIETYRNMSKEDKLKFNEKKLSKRCKTNMDKYGVPFAQMLPEVKEKIVKTCLDKYGEVSWSKTSESKENFRKILYTKYDRYSNFFPKFSWNSQKLFSEIEKNIDVPCLYATNGSNENNEYQVFISEGFTRFLDFYIPQYNIWIEFDEKHHKYMEEDDRIRERQIMSKIEGIKLLRISENDFLVKPQEVLDKCILFVYSNK